MGTYRLLPLFFLSFLAVLSAQQAPPSRCKVEGVVINSATGKPLPRVLVEIGGHAMLTSQEGEFSFDGVPAGMTQIQFNKPGYFVPSTGRPIQAGQPVSKMFDIRPETGKIILKLSPEAIISGRVTGQDEEPLEGVSVELQTYIWEDGRRILTTVPGATQTDEDGDFHIGALSAGRYILAVKAAGASRRMFGEQSAKAMVSYPALVYYPGSEDLAAAVPIDLAPGQKMDARISLSLLPAYNLAGKVVVAGEWKQINPPLIVDSQNELLFDTNQFDAASGTFEFRAVPAGTYILRVQGQDNQNFNRVTDRKITVSQSVTNLQLSLQPGITIPVVARTEFSKPFQPGSCMWREGQNVEPSHSDCSDFPPARVELVGVDSRTQFWTDFKPVREPLDYAVAGVTPGKYMVRAQASFGGYVQSLRSGGVDLLHEYLIVPEDGDVPPIEVVLRDDSGMLKVAMHSQQAGEAATLVVFPEGALSVSLSMMRTIVSGQRAEAYFGPLPPGNYKVLAFDVLDGVVLDDPEVLAKYVSQAVNVTVAANGNAAVTVDVIHTGE